MVAVRRGSPIHSRPPGDLYLLSTVVKYFHQGLKHPDTGEPMHFSVATLGRHLGTTSHHVRMLLKLERPEGSNW